MKNKEQTLKFLKNKRFELAHLVINTQEALIAQIGKDPLIDNYYHGMMMAIDSLLRLENKAKGGE
jgi:hypothetical protein